MLPGLHGMDALSERFTVAGTDSAGQADVRWVIGTLWSSHMSREAGISGWGVTGMVGLITAGFEVDGNATCIKGSG